MQEISNLKIFDGIEKEVILSLIWNLQKEIYQLGEYILKQWDESNGKWYIILSWEVEVSIDGEVITSLQTWDIFWEIALLNEEQRTADIKTLSEVQVLILSLESILDIINSGNDSINRDIMKRLEENLIRSEQNTHAK